MLASLCVCRGQKLVSDIFLCQSSPYFWRQSLSLNPKLINLLDCLSNKSQDPLSLPPCSFQCKDYRNAGTLDCLCGCWGSEHCSSGLCSEQFNHRAISICPGFNIILVMFWALHSLWILSGTFPYYCPFDTFRRTVLFQVLSYPKAVRSHGLLGVPMHPCIAQMHGCTGMSVLQWNCWYFLCRFAPAPFQVTPPQPAVRPHI